MRPAGLKLDRTGLDVEDQERDVYIKTSKTHLQMFLAKNR